MVWFIEVFFKAALHLALPSMTHEKDVVIPHRLDLGDGCPPKTLSLKETEDCDRDHVNIFTPHALQN